MDKDDDVIFDACYRTSVWINENNSITIEQYNNLNEEDNEEEFKTSYIDIPLLHVDILIAMLKKLRNEAQESADIRSQE